nr:hypothetical protein [Tanacetum cinerariifolium]
VDTKFEKSSVIRQPNAFKSQRPSVLGKPTTFSNSFIRKDFSKSTSVTKNNVSNDFLKPVTAQNLPTNKKSCLKNTNVLAPGMYKIYTDHTQARTSKLPQDSKKTNKRVSFSTGVILITSVSRPQLKSNPRGDRVLHSNGRGKKLEVEEHRRNVKLSKNKTKTVASESNKKPRNNVRKLYEHLIEIVLFIVDYGCSKHMTGNLKLLINFVEKFLGTATSSQAWLWNRRLSHLNFDTINLLSKNDIVVGLPKLKFIKNHLCSSCELGKAKRKSFHTKLTPSLKTRLHLLHMDLCGPMRVASINGKRYVLVIVDDYSRYTWTHFLRSKDETPEVLIDFLRLVQRGLQAQVRVVRTDKGTKFLNQTLLAYFVVEGIQHQTVAKVPLFFWAEAIATACFTQNRSLVIPHHEKTPYHIINNRKPSVKFFHIFGSVCYIVRDGENLDKMKEKGDECIFVGTDPAPTRQNMASAHNSTDPAPTRQNMASVYNSSDPAPTCQTMASVQISSDPAPECQTMAHEHNSLSPRRKCQENASHGDKTVTTSNELDLLFKPHDENDQVADDEFINIFSTPVQDQGETSSRHVDSSNIHTFYQRYPSEQRWTKDQPLEQVIGNPSQSVRTRRQLESDAEMCMFALTVSQTEPKNIKEAMSDSAWIKSMQEELHQFDRLD